MSAYHHAIRRTHRPKRRLRSWLVTLGQWALPRSMVLVRLVTWALKWLRLGGV